MNDATANLCLTGISITIALLLGELAIRIAAPQLIYRFPRGLFVADPVVSYRLTPGFRGVLDTPEYHTRVGINRQGLREDRDYGPKHPGVTRILMLGDSFTMGVGVELESGIAKRLEYMLNSEGATRPVEVINAGVPGYSTRQEVAHLSTYLLDLQPDLVLLGFFIGNDIHENAEHPSRVDDGYLVAPNEPTSGILPSALRRFLGLHSQLYRLLWPYQRRLLADGRAEDEAAAAAHVAIYLTCGADAASVEWSATFEALTDLMALTRARRLPLAVVLMPEAAQSDRAVWSAMLPRAAAPKDCYQPTLPNERLSAFLTDARARVHDLLPAFLQAQAPATLYFKQDHHWTDAGSTVAAQSLYPFVRDLLATTRPAS